ncbi:unnamed protein product [Sphagnum balticum]
MGGSAADAAVAMAAALNLAEPCSTGIGGDAFALYFDPKTKKVSCLMGNGASSRHVSLALLAERGFGTGPGLQPLPRHHGLCVTVPGAVALWEDLLARHGSGNLTMSDVLAPAIEAAERGTVIHPVTAAQWAVSHLQGAEAMRVFKLPNKAPHGTSESGDELTHKPSNGSSMDRHTPAAGELFRNPDLASTFRQLAADGAQLGFYRGRIAAAVAAAVAQHGGVLDEEDLAHHRTEIAAPVAADYKGYRVYETPPPTHGVAALIALKLLEAVDARTGGSTENGQHIRRGDERQAHVMLECMRLAYSDALGLVCDPLCCEEKERAQLEALLSARYIAARAALVTETSAEVSPGDPSPYLEGDTVYFCCTDQWGGACSMINSNYTGFGTGKLFTVFCPFSSHSTVGIVPLGCGFTLQNRGHNVSLEPNHPNVAGPRKRPYHTIIPGLITRPVSGQDDEEEFYCVFGNMGGFMQPSEQ